MERTADNGDADTPNRSNKYDNAGRWNSIQSSPELPLSEVALGLPCVPVHDVRSFASRSVSVREMELDATGKVKRPLNAFMLYRKAYQDVAKASCMGNNHQQVSTVCGQSWRRETPVIHTLFRELADKEKSLHLQAFPNYRYEPAQVRKQASGACYESRRYGDRLPVRSTVKKSRPHRRRRGQVGGDSSMPPSRDSGVREGDAAVIGSLSGFTGGGLPSYVFPPLPVDNNGCVVEVDMYGGMPAVPGPSHYGGGLQDTQEQCIDPSLISGQTRWSNMDHANGAQQHWSFASDGVLAEPEGQGIDYLKGTDADWYLKELCDLEQIEKWFSVQ